MVHEVSGKRTSRQNVGKCRLCQGKRTSQQNVGKGRLWRGKKLRDKMSGSGMELVGNGKKNDDPV